MDLRPGTVFCGYRIERLLGTGGMGAVYLAAHPRLSRLVALKVLDEARGRDARVRARFEREAELAGRLEHPHIVPVFDRSAPGAEILWLSMRYVEGGDAAAAVRQAGPLELRRAIRLIADAAAGLDFAHRHQVLHRDVKPANILIDGDDADGERALVADFGIARAVDDTVTAGVVSGSFAYTAPELFEADGGDHRADIYSFGCTVFELLTGRTPFVRSDQASMIAAHLAAPPPSLRAIRPDVPAELDAAVTASLAKDPGERPGTCGELVAAVRAGLSGWTALPPPQGPGPESVSPPPAGAADTVGAGPGSGDAAVGSRGPENAVETESSGEVGDFGRAGSTGGAVRPAGEGDSGRSGSAVEAGSTGDANGAGRGGTTGGGGGGGNAGVRRRRLLAVSLIAAVIAGAVAVGVGVWLSEGARRPATGAASSGVASPSSGAALPAQDVEPPRVVGRCGGPGEIRPVTLSSMHCGSNADLAIEKIEWTDWTGTMAMGSGIMQINSCEPTCSAGNYLPRKVFVKLSEVNRFTNVYVRLTITGDGVGSEVDELPEP
ncbi:serine/threonine protein kinase [Nocardia sp. CA2R105]|uniref:serine/threonine-protein kinase n=1 Tax=Nocardia coffeae TaxID=2873381 RepID=UPI001CA6C8F2|nr:serine/threonine-protein kinase [Nocardia coffeae]MBY8860563.1 serine/threonine protein kinase [Nocardia coffeae]